MPPLSSKFHNTMLVDIVTDRNSTCLRNLVLSSREMSHLFDVFMRTVTAVYRSRRLKFTVFIDGYPQTCALLENVPLWTAPFIRKLWINSEIADEDIFFFQKVYLSYNPLDLDLTRVYISTESPPAFLNVTRNLVSITQRLTMQTHILDINQDFLSHFDTLSLERVDRDGRGRSYNAFAKAIAMGEKSSNILHLHTSKNPLAENSQVFSCKEKLQGIQTIYFTWNTKMNNFWRVGNDCLSFFPNAKNINIHISFEWRDCLLMLKVCYNRLLTNLQNIPRHIKVKMNLKTHYHRYEHFDQLDAIIFPVQYFEVQDQGGLKIYSGRQKKISDNVELSFTAMEF